MACSGAMVLYCPNLLLSILLTEYLWNTRKGPGRKSMIGKLAEDAGRSSAILQAHLLYLTRGNFLQPDFGATSGDITGCSRNKHAEGAHSELYAGRGLSYNRGPHYKPCSDPTKGMLLCHRNAFRADYSSSMEARCLRVSRDAKMATKTTRGRTMPHMLILSRDERPEADP